jgi:L-threonylcarbamoyladenylate synthase
MSGAQPRLLRPGATSREAIEAAIGPVIDGKAVVAEAAVSPGLLKSHYAPRIPLITHNGETICQVSDDGDSAFLFFDGASRDNWLLEQKRPQGEAKPKAAIAVLSETGNMLEAAARLFEALHELERLKVSKINAQLAPEQGLGMAINDRLRRGSEKNEQ